MTRLSDRSTAEARFRDVFAHLGNVTAYARRRGSDDAEAVAAETMAIAWRKLADVPFDDPRPWLYATARNLLHAEWRRRRRFSLAEAPETAAPAEPELASSDPAVTAALRTLSREDQEVLLLVAWDDLSARLAARSLGIREATFRVRLYRARRRFRAALEPSAAGSAALVATADMEER
jgi:RNA polymerase sigma-70 factor (ECF subfamily)